MYQSRKERDHNEEIVTFFKTKSYNKDGPIEIIPDSPSSREEFENDVKGFLKTLLHTVFSFTKSELYVNDIEDDEELSNFSLSLELMMSSYKKLNNKTSFEKHSMGETFKYYELVNLAEYLGYRNKYGQIPTKTQAIRLCVVGYSKRLFQDYDSIYSEFLQYLA